METAIRVLSSAGFMERSSHGRGREEWAATGGLAPTDSGVPEGLTRRRLLSRAAGAAVGGSVAALGPAAGVSIARPVARLASSQGMWAGRALDAYRALQRYFYVNDGSGLYHESYPYAGTHPHSYLWPYSRVLVGTLTFGGIPRGLLGGRNYRAAVDHRLASLGHYWDRKGKPPGYDTNMVPPLSTGGDKYYDDNAWIGLALVQHYRMTGKLSSLRRARQVFHFVYPSGWGSAASPYRGGVFWVQQGIGTGQSNHDRTTTSTAPNGELGFHLAQILDPGAYLEPASLMQEWVSSNLYNVNHSGLVYDKVAGNGAIDPTLWTYNQGALVAANVMRYRVTGQGAYLREAEAIAAVALEHFSQSYIAHSPAFTAVYFRGLLQLHAVSGRSRLKAAIQHAMRTYATNVWNNQRSTGNLFGFPNAPAGTFLLLNQAAVLQTFSALAWNPSDYPMLA